MVAAVARLAQSAVARAVALGFERRAHAQAGGLHAGNVGQAIAAVRPHGLDLCSRVRTEGRLDAAKLGAFMAAARH